MRNDDKHRPVRLLLTGGGTGGHLFPAIATAQQLIFRRPASSVLFIGTRRKLDKKHLARYGYSIATVHSYGLKGKRWLELIKALAVLPLTFCEAVFHILRFRPHLVFGVGGYVTGPVIAAAWLMRKKTVIHEQNAIPGLANRKLGGIVDKICLSLPDSRSYFPIEKTALTGNPVRTQIIEAAQNDSAAGGDMTILVLGGSQGARAINELMVELFSTADAELNKCFIIHQTGVADEQFVKEAYEEYGVAAKVSAFFDDMADVYSQSNFVISRAGATTLAELAVLGKPALLIPYPHAADNHQEKNAQRFVDHGAALLFSQRTLSAERLGQEIKRLFLDRAALEGMAEQMKQLGIPDAADRIVDISLELIEK